MNSTRALLARIQALSPELMMALDCATVLPAVLSSGPGFGLNGADAAAPNRVSMSNCPSSCSGYAGVGCVEATS
jgi:hypothetical protein